jgi:hypothetical protein
MRQTRTAVAEEATKLARRGNLTVDGIVASVHAHHQKAVDAENSALVEYAIRTLANEKLNLRPPKINSRQLDLFEPYGISSGTMVAVPDSSGKRSKRIRLPTMKLAEARQYIDDHTRVPKPSRLVVAMRRIVNDVGSDADPNMTLADCLKAKVAKASKAKG